MCSQTLRSGTLTGGLSEFPPNFLENKCSEHGCQAQVMAGWCLVWYSTEGSLRRLQVSALRPKSVCMTEAVLHVAQCTIGLLMCPIIGALRLQFET